MACLAERASVLLESVLPPRYWPSAEDPDTEFSAEHPLADLHSLRRRDHALDLLAQKTQDAAVAAAVDGVVPDVIEALRAQRVLVTGSAGYLGAPLVLTLRALGIEVVGLDIVAASTVDVCGDIAEAGVVERAADGCDLVLNVAALHAPHASTHHVSSFYAVNVRGTANILALGKPTVHTSTTSLTITPRVKDLESQSRCVWLDNTVQQPFSGYLPGTQIDVEDEPRNKYGRSKKLGEGLCARAAADGLSVLILRAPRFFPEDVLEGNRMTLANLKANEIMGRRVALADLLDAEIRALARVHSGVLCEPLVLTIVAPWPLTQDETSEDPAANSKSLARRYPRAAEIYQHHGWELPGRITRVYDAATAMSVLSWRPHLTWERILEVLASPDRSFLQDALLRGAY